ncbi:MAG: glycosyltransferase family 4 protein, partial [Polyangiales bacterium]
MAAILVGPVRAMARRLGAVSLPGGRHVHKAATPRLGGVAILFGVLVPLSILFNVDAGAAVALRAESTRAIGIAVGGAFMCAIGFIDDVRGVRALYKLFAQIAAATVAWMTGFRIESVHLPIIGDLSMGIFSYPVSTIWIVGIINAINLIDGLDGLAAGVAIFAALTNFVVAYLAESTLVALVMVALLGATLGFLFHNFNPARIFMGDSGSYFIGYVLATCAIIGSYQKASTTVSILVPVLALGVPILDTLFAIVRRFLERRPLFSPDRGHIHHRLLDMGLTHRRVVLIIYGVSVAFTASGIAIALGRQWQIGIALLSATVVLVALIKFVGYVEQINQSVR